MRPVDDDQTWIWRGGAWVNATTALEHYKPKTMPADRWALIEPLVKQAVGATLKSKKQPSVAATRVRMRVTTRFLSWCVDMGFALEAEEVFTEDRVEAYFAAGDGPARSKATYRSHLRAVAKAATTKAIWTPTPQLLKNNTLRPPYSALEIERYFEVAALQPTERKAFVMRSVLLCCLGFGLRSHEMFLLRCDQVSRDADGVVLVALEDRIVPAQQPYAADVWDLISGHSESERLLGDHLRLDRGLDQIVRKLDVPDYLPPLRTRRLRTTYLRDLLANRALNLAEFMQIAGLSSGRVLEDLIDNMAIDQATLLTRGALGPTVVPTVAGDLDG